MPRSLGESDLLAALADRYDHQSARTVLQEAVLACDLAERREFTPAEVSRIAWWLQQQGDRAQPAASALLELVGRASGPEPGVFGDGEDGEPDDPDWQPLSEGEVRAFFQQVAEAAVAVAVGKSDKRNPD
ncbi:MAG: hypothetical protein FJ100_19645 [Deltaproteobacteria bacterium]|nr:hypothetical protein [Deltaproteobacteria bacterium]